MNAPAGRPASGPRVPARGSVYLLVIGILSVMILLLFGLSRRMSRQVQLMTLSDQTQTAFYLLEACVEDVVSQIRLGLKNGDPALVRSFVRPVTGGAPDLVYHPSQSLEALAAELKATLAGPPALRFTDFRPLPYPEGVAALPAEVQEQEGCVAVTCRLTLRGRSFRLEERVPFKVVARLTPVLREFILFCDQMHLEQGSIAGDADGINILQVQDGEHPDALTPGYAGIAGKPWNLMPNNSNPFDAHANGKIFLGRSDRPIVLNLAGEATYRQGDMSELFHVTPQTFPAINPDGASFTPLPVFPDAEGRMLSLRTLQLPLEVRDSYALLGLLGFGLELADDHGGPYAGTLLTMDYLLNGDPGFATYRSQRRHLAPAAAVKLLGRNFQRYIPPEVPYLPPVRQIFGRVYQRFLLASLWTFPGCAGVGIPLPFRDDPGFLPEDGLTWDGTRFPFRLPRGTYADYMSRSLSSGGSFAAIPAARILPANRDARGEPKEIHAADFASRDHLALSCAFEEFAARWFRPFADPGPDPGATVLGRISRCFTSQDEFKTWAGLPQGRLWVDGVVAIDGPLELEDFDGTDVRGGVVLVNGPISLGAITRGFTPSDPGRPLCVDAGFNTLINTMKPEQVLTFVSLTGDPITLRDDVQIGVQLISCRPGLGSPVDLIRWEKGQRVALAGGVAVSTPYLVHRVAGFRSVPDFFYVPGMASEPTPMAVSILEEREGYDFAVE